MQTGDKIRLYRSLFRGRDDVFAKRSPTTGAYFPAHTLNWDEFNAHKASGGRMATFKNKKLTPLTDEIILKHLTGHRVAVGVSRADLGARLALDAVILRDRVLDAGDAEGEAVLLGG